MADCLNGGSCLFDKKKETFSCSCKLPWSGDKCEVQMGKNFSFLMKSIFSLGCNLQCVTLRRNHILQRKVKS